MFFCQNSREIRIGLAQDSTQSLGKRHILRQEGGLVGSGGRDAELGGARGARRNLI